jgi:hypothetical protein
MSAVDPFTRASATYQAAIRAPHKSGQAWEGYSPRPRSSWPLVLLGFAVTAAAVHFMGAF